jgi:hypothetical protein
MSDSSAPRPAEAPEGDREEPPAVAEPSPKKKKRKKKGNLTSRRGIETMFRSTYREQLDLTALADSKANIMIQLNGVIVSIMLASSGVIMESHPWLWLPSASLTATALVSILFAVLAARPNLKKQTPMTFEDIRTGHANILFFGNFARISEEQFVEGMREMFSESEHVYLNMTRHVHGLGTILLRKFLLLRVAYTVFLAGLCVSTILFFVSLLMAAANGDERFGGRGDGRDGAAAYHGRLAGMYEPSGVVQLLDGRLLVVEDEPRRPMALYSLGSDFELTRGGELDLGASAAGEPTLGELDDLEGAAFDASRGLVYAVTSFSRTARVRPGREKLVRFRVTGSSVSEVRVRADLGPMLAARVDGELNVEGLAFDARERRLLLGLRAPLRDGMALVIPVDEATLFDETPRVGEPIALDLDAEGIRGMTFDPELGGFVLLGHREGGGKHAFHIWLWDGERAPTRITPRGVELGQAEGVTPVVVDGEKRLLIVSDEGKRKKGKTAGYVLLSYDQLSLEG